MGGRALSRLKRVSLDELPEARLRALDAEATETASRIVLDVGARGEPAVREWAERLGELRPGDPLVIGRAGMETALAGLPSEERGILERARDRVLSFARAQRDALGDIDVPIPGGRAGHTFRPVARAGCYAPGGRFPLPSSAIMTACAARAAGVASIWCAGPRPTVATLAAAALSGAEGFLAVGGAQGIAALAYGAGVPPCDVVVGPGGRYVAAAKRLLFGQVGTEAPAGPSELLVIAGAGASPELAAADLLAQAEHDVAAIPAIVVVGGGRGDSGGFAAGFAEALDEALERRLAELPEPNRSTAAASLRNGWLLLAGDEAEAIAAAERFAPEHLELLVADPRAWAASIGNAGAVFLGQGSAEVFGDYGAGPNHCLPTGGASRFSAGLSVLAFLRARTWLEMGGPGAGAGEAGFLAGEAAALARIEGLEGHARAAELRLQNAAGEV